MIPKAAKAGLAVVTKRLSGLPPRRPDKETRTPSQTLETLPFELLEHIFCLACADGGRTACSLSLVSKHIRAISRSTRFHSVSLRRGVISQLDRFAAAYERACEEAAVQHAPRPCVRHLAVVMVVDIEEYPDKQRRAVVWVPPGSTTYHATYALARAYHEELARLFQRVNTADLQSLMLLGCDPTAHSIEHCAMCRPIECPYGFSELRELTMTRGGVQPFVCATYDGNHGAHSPDSGPRPLYPALKRLYMWLEHDSEMDFEYWAIQTPRLEAMEISVRCPVQQEIKFLPGFLSVLSKTRFNDSLGMPTSEPLWPELKQVTFAYLARLVSSQLEADREAYIRFIRELESFKDALPHPWLINFTPSYRLQDGDDADVSSREVDSWETARGYAFMYVNWVIRLRGNPSMATPDYGSEFWESKSMLQTIQGSHVLTGVAKRLRSVFGKDTRDTRNRIFWGQ
ncbi:hypothetical protein GY45DRAFT_1431532 [Cubamyces sp. BRFM 1775]|nr:hypothetical protein GY45DRAFT_1431532 [Cubamyces sp. BRFM 1775]